MGYLRHGAHLNSNCTHKQDSKQKVLISSHFGLPDTIQCLNHINLPKNIHLALINLSRLSPYIWLQRSQILEIVQFILVEKLLIMVKAS